MGLVGKFVFYNHFKENGDDEFCQSGEVVEACGDYYVFIKWHHHGPGTPADDSLMLVAVDEMTLTPANQRAWQFFATREQLDAYKDFVGVHAIVPEKEESGTKVVKLRAH